MAGDLTFYGQSRKYTIRGKKNYYTRGPKTCIEYISSTAPPPGARDLTSAPRSDGWKIQHYADILPPGYRCGTMLYDNYRSGTITPWACDGIPPRKPKAAVAPSWHFRGQVTIRELYARRDLGMGIKKREPKLAAGLCCIPPQILLPAIIILFGYSY